MKCSLILCALVAACSAAPNGFAYYSPYTPYSQVPYYFGAPGFSYAISEAAPIVSYAKAPIAPVAIAPAPAAPAVLAVPSAVDVPIISSAPIKGQYYSQDALGQAKYGHDEPGQSHHAIQDAAGNKFGTFSYIRSDGKVVITQYSADQAGYRVASNDLPIGPGQPAPAEAPFAVPILPIASDVPVVPVAAPVVPVVAADAPAAPAVPVVAADSPAVEPTANAAPVAADSPAPSSDASDDTVQVENVERTERKRRAVVLPNGYLADTPEVAAAKAAHFAEHAKATNNYYPYAYSGYPYAYSGYPYAYSGYPYAYAGYPYAYSAYPYASAPTVVTPEGYLADTPDVAAAKAAHFAEHAIARSRARRDTSAAKEIPKVKRAHLPASTSPLATPLALAAPAPVVVPAPAPLAVAYPAPAFTYSAPAFAYSPFYQPAPVSFIKSPAYPYVYPWAKK